MLLLRLLKARVVGASSWVTPLGQMLHTHVAPCAVPPAPLLLQSAAW